MSNNTNEMNAAIPLVLTLQGLYRFKCKKDAEIIDIIFRRRKKKKKGESQIAGTIHFSNFFGLTGKGIPVIKGKQVI